MDYYSMKNIKSSFLLCIFIMNCAKFPIIYAMDNEKITTPKITANLQMTLQHRIQTSELPEFLRDADNAGHYNEDIMGILFHRIKNPVHICSQSITSDISKYGEQAKKEAEQNHASMVKK